jgi:GST-like protein
MDVLNRALAERPFIAGDELSIADMAIWPWYGALVKGVLYNAAEFRDAKSYTHVLRWSKAIADRPAAKRGRVVNRAWGPLETQLKERHDASDIDRLIAQVGA